MKGQLPGKPGARGGKSLRKGFDVPIWNIAPGEHCLGRPCSLNREEEGAQPIERVLGEPPVGGDLAAEDRQERGPPLAAIYVEDIIARDRGRVLRLVVIERPDPRKGMSHVLPSQLVTGVAVHRRDQIIDLGRIDRDIVHLPFIGDIRRADETEIAFIRIDEDDPLVMVLEQIGLGSAPELRHDDVAALDQPHAAPRIHTGDPAEDILDPRPGGVDEHAGLGANLGSVASPHLDVPGIAGAPGRYGRRSRQDRRAPLGGIERIQDDKARIIDPTVRFLESNFEFSLDRLALGISVKMDASAARKLLSLAKMIIQEQAEPNEPRRSLVWRMRKDDSHRPHDIRSRAEKNLALREGLAHEAKLEMLEVTQAAVNVFPGAGARAFGEITFLAQNDAQSPARRIPGDACAVDAAADDQEIDRAKLLHPARVSTDWRGARLRDTGELPPPRGGRHA